MKLGAGASEDSDIAEDFVKDEAEAAFIAEKISELLKNGKKADGSPIREEDIAILFRSGTSAEALIRELERKNIRYADSSKNNFFENPDVLMMLSLLSAIDNPQRDVQLAGTLISPVFDFTLSEVLDIRRSAGKNLSLFDALLSYAAEKKDGLAEKCVSFASVLEKYRDMSRSLPAHKLIKNIYDSDTLSAWVLFRGQRKIL